MYIKTQFRDHKGHETNGVCLNTGVHRLEEQTKGNFSGQI